MKILFIEPHVYIPQLYGGVQASTDQLCRALILKGHKVAVLACVRHGGVFAWKSLIKMKMNAKIFHHKVSRDTGLGYPVWRTWMPEDVVEYVAEKEKPDLIVAMTGKIVPTVLAAKRTKIPIAVQLNDVAFHALGGNFGDLGDVPCIANSRFTAEKYRGVFGVDSVVIYPFMSQAKYRTETTRENVTFINPVVQKGRSIALNIARLCPDIPFSFIETLPLRNEENKEFLRELSGFSNVTLLPPQKDMRRIYGKCKILLVPSLCEEAYGRVTSEAQISGIPVAASNRGGLPEAVGTGGVLLDPDSTIDIWAGTLRKIWQDEKYYAELSAAALAYAQRPDLSPAYQIEAHEKAMCAAIDRFKNARQ